MKMIQFIVGTIVGGMIGVAMMCLMQINRLYLTGKGDGQHEQHGSSEGVRRGRDTAN